MDIFDFLSDRKILIGIGIGIILATSVMIQVKINYKMSKSQIEDNARGLGMQYPQDMKVINDNGGKK